jgi:hypothetical protein
MAKAKSGATRGWRQRTVQQWGEYLVAAELAKRGYLATTFTGNVPHFDLVVTDEEGRTANVQVKAKSEKGNWQFDLGKFAKIETRPDGTHLIRKRRMHARDTLWVLVHLHLEREADFYWFGQEEFQHLILRKHRRYLRLHGGKRARKQESRHSSIAPRGIGDWRNNWDAVGEAFRSH